MGGKGDLTKMTETFTILGLISRDKSKNIKEAWMYVFGPPGWSPDGSRQTAKQMQQQLEAEKAKASKG